MTTDKNISIDINRIQVTCRRLQFPISDHRLFLNMSLLWLESEIG